MAMVTYGSVTGRVVGKVEGDYKGKPNVTFQLLQQKGNRAGFAQVRILNDGRELPKEGEDVTFSGVLYGYQGGVLVLVD
ncbi:hypothetical protein Dhaf_2703 [Desulfitobacterium hafniense DCB-2]|uniref:Uncharacterized protein n=1 Tax=Desulfitobacterium hafniense (strain DSM 10664 / DCB-2) TaxID=272564 RepID=B8FWB7_DESHD|nr:hypothetical protein [Desulfitobacterium hafniense]ACL20729.1 hypothetical protein Dhaf_2703 [Desulfitobacterium hafniense DCB-2]